MENSQCTLSLSLLMKALRWRCLLLVACYLLPFTCYLLRERRVGLNRAREAFIAPVTELADWPAHNKVAALCSTKRSPSCFGLQSGGFAGPAREFIWSEWRTLRRFTRRSAAFFGETRELELSKRRI